jgi:hypothetical protein
MTQVRPVRAAEDDSAPASELEGQIREVIRRDVAPAQRAAEADVDLVASNINAVIQRVAAPSVSEIDRFIGELQTMRDFLQAEGRRVQLEIVSYAQLSQAAMKSSKIISDAIGHWKTAVDTAPNEE